MSRLREQGLDDAIRDRIAQNRPLLAICLGLQLLCTHSEESPGVEGLGVIRATVRRLPQGVRTPQFGWNRVEPKNTALITNGYAYYANSYCLTEQPEGWDCATSTHGVRFVAALERGPVLACQFHPELSGPWGSELIKNWIARAEERAAC
jgi:imidazole glycerol phosphate synthase glutamine amidotransferase subunit